MDKKQILSALKKVKEGKKRNFSQTYDLVINLKNLDLKKPEEKVDLFLTLPYQRGKDIKICALIDKDLSQEAKQCEHFILKDDFSAYAKKQKNIKKLAKEYDFFIAQANIMPDIAKTFGKVLGQRGKMPNPKSGCIVPPKSSLKPIIERLKKMVRVRTNNELIVRAAVGKEEMKDEEIVANIEYVYNNVLRVLPEDVKDIKSVLIKLTMGKPVYLFGEDLLRKAPAKEELPKKGENKPKKRLKIQETKKVSGLKEKESQPKERIKREEAKPEIEEKPKEKAGEKDGK